MGMREFGFLLTATTVIGGAAYYAYESHVPTPSELYVGVDTGVVSLQGINGPEDRHYGRLNDPTRLLDTARLEAAKRGLPVGNLAVRWTGDGGGMREAQCSLVSVGGIGGNPLEKPSTYVASLASLGDFCTRVFPFVNAATVAGPDGVTPNVARFPVPVPAQTTPTPHP